MPVSKKTMLLPLTQSSEQSAEWENKVLSNMYMNEGEEIVATFACPALANGYDWSKFVCKEAATRQPFNITDNYFDENQNVVTDFYVVQQLNFMGKNVNPESKASMRNQIVCHRRNMSKTCDLWLKWYFQDVAYALKWKTEDKEIVKTYKQIQQMMREARSLNDMNKFVGLFYLSFDYIPNWKDDLAEALLRHHSLSMDYTFKRQVSMDPTQKKGKEKE